MHLYSFSLFHLVVYVKKDKHVTFR